MDIVGAKSDQQVNICSFTVRYDRMWPSTQYTQDLYWLMQQALRPVEVGRWLYSWAQVLEVCCGVTNE